MLIILTAGLLTASLDKFQTQILKTVSQQLTLPSRKHAADQPFGFQVRSKLLMSTPVCMNQYCGMIIGSNDNVYVNGDDHQLCIPPQIYRALSSLVSLRFMADSFTFGSRKLFSEEDLTNSQTQPTAKLATSC